MIRSLIFLLFVTGTSAGQGLLVAPADQSQFDATALLGVAGIGISEQQQILIDAEHLQGVVGREIHALLFRRDFGYQGPLDAASASVTIKVGAAAHRAAKAVPDFAANLPTPTTVYDGVVTIPASPHPSGRTVGWTGADVVEIALTTPFTYTGGTLCIEISGSPATSVWWPVDAVEDPASGTVVREGHACGPRAAILGETASVAAADLVIGRTAIFKLFGEPDRAAILMIGLDTLAQPLSLDFIGATGCELRVDAFAAIATSTTPPLPDAELGAVANVQLHLPARPELAGASFASQFVEVAVPDLTTSNTLICRISPTETSIGMSLVLTRANRSPVVHAQRAPVVGLRWR